MEKQLKKYKKMGISSPFSFKYVHMSRVQKFLTTACKDLNSYFGYSDKTKWEIVQKEVFNEEGKYKGYYYEVCSKVYKETAYYENGEWIVKGKWVYYLEGKGKTPLKALMTPIMQDFMRCVELLKPIFDFQEEVFKEVNGEIIYNGID